MAKNPQRYDVVVIGGGINGAGVAWDLALRGYKVCLLEKADFGSGSSSGCFRIIHGGLRYLQHLDFRRLIESVSEQRTLRKIAPHLVQPLRFVVPSSGKGMRSKFVLGIGLGVYQLLTFWKNRGVHEEQHLPNFELLSKDKCLQDFPGLDATQVDGAVAYSDCQIFNCDRFTYSIVHSAKAAGAITLNYHQVTNFNVDGKLIKSALVKNTLTGEEFEIESKFFINASGPWVDSVLDLADKRKRPDVFSKGVQAVISEQICEKAIAIESQFVDKSAIVSRGGRSFFLVPWRGQTLVGTSDSVFKGEPDEYSIDQSEVKDLLEEVENLTGKQVALSSFGGLRPVDFGQLNRASEGDATVSKDDIIESYPDVDNLISLLGVKYTTFRSFAEKAADLVVFKLGNKERSNCLTSAMKIYGAEFPSLSELESDLNEANIFCAETNARLARDYGCNSKEIVDLAKENPQLRVTIGQSSGVTAAELVYVTRQEQVVQLDDALKRRTPFFSFEPPSEEEIKTASELVSRELSLKGEQSLHKINRLVSST